jgi:hypothetical protein
MILLSGHNVRTLRALFAAPSAESAHKIASWRSSPAIDHCTRRRGSTTIVVIPPHDPQPKGIELPRYRPACARGARVIDGKSHVPSSNRDLELTPLASGHSRLSTCLLAAAEPSDYHLYTLESSNACFNVSASTIRTRESLHRRPRSRTVRNHRGNFVKR